MEWDPWCGGRSLQNILASFRFMNPFVNSYFSNNYWSLPTNTPLILRNEISGINIGENSVVFWEGCDKPSFSSFYSSYFSNYDEVSWHKFIWHKGKSLRFTSYTWMALLGKLKMADLLISRGINVLPNCVFCSNGCENHSHMFFTCDYSYTVIISLLPCLDVFLLRPNLLQAFEFIEDSLSYNRWERNFCYLIICSSIYYLWKERSTRKFEKLWNSPSQLCRIIRRAVFAKVKSWKQFDELNGRFGIAG
ncbi:hypothetical protein KFK09_009328 [Dendrobium nobile]|uniref:Reverse transcriptase zinc-binding domain-containing protein n=1 Tax=Dendrobium nobile TaxID=94219 RepID=A0A8T3BN29_DENNO|nr:hypothetical protein KFK09_009328 [Dendrobium nobile]